jgi:hypothetical protein
VSRFKRIGLEARLQRKTRQTFATGALAGSAGPQPQSRTHQRGSWIRGGVSDERLPTEAFALGANVACVARSRSHSIGGDERNLTFRIDRL